MALVVVLIERMSLPAMSGAANIAHMVLVGRHASAALEHVRIVPVPRASVLRQWLVGIDKPRKRCPGVSYIEADAPHVRDLRLVDRAGRWHTRARAVNRIDAVEDGTTGRDERVMHRLKARHLRPIAVVVLQVVNTPRGKCIGVLSLVSLASGLARACRGRR